MRFRLDPRNGRHVLLVALLAFAFVLGAVLAVGLLQPNAMAAVAILAGFAGALVLVLFVAS
jgi:hypothetical protein